MIVSQSSTRHAVFLGVQPDGIYDNPGPPDTPSRFDYVTLLMDGLTLQAADKLTCEFNRRQMLAENPHRLVAFVVPTSFLPAECEAAAADVGSEPRHAKRHKAEGRAL